MSLGFANPLLLWGLAAAALPLLVHLFFRRRPRPVPFPALELLLRARQQTERRLRLRRVLLFLARTALLAAAALAIARPALRSSTAAAATARGPAATAILLDASASMGYRLGGATLFERAREDALASLASLGNDEPATALVCDGGTPRAAPPGFDRAGVRRLLESAAPTFLHADLTACAAAAVRALSDSASSRMLAQRLVVATDLTAAAWRLDAPPPLVQTPSGAVRPEVVLLDAARGAALPDLGITDLAVEPDPAMGPRGYRVTVTLANRGPRAVADVPVVLRTGFATGGPVAVRAFASVPPGGVIQKQLGLSFPAGGPAAVQVSLPEDALAYDDARAATVAVPREVRALVVDGAASPVKYRDEAFFVEAALSSPASPVRPTVVDAESLGGVKLDGYDVVMLLNVRSLGAKARELRDFVERGGGLFVALGGQVDPDRYGEELGPLLPRGLHLVKTAAEKGTPGAAERAARFATVDYAHPALSIFAGAAGEGLEGARTWKYMLLKPGDPKRADAGHVLMAFDDGAPALVEARRGRGRVLLFTSTMDREWSDWAIRTSFLPAVQRFAAWLAGSLEERRDAPSRVGAPREVRPAEGQRVVALLGPDGRERPLAAPAAGGPPVAAPDRPGLWQVKVEEGGRERLDPALAFAVLPDPREADTTRLDPSELTAWFGGATHARLAGGGAPRGERSLPLWSILLAAAVLLFLAEGALIASPG